ncbi:hypothetical protein Mkiyose1665_57120 [Mycobacterium kiyosense]|jgi:hypothetical protein|uniref:Uncharacterized protein n=1 Tax=Mycobacterium kiyosense TaxID=2871094 RepID=A0AA37V7T0_9MYCO|nr:hypothetical protein MKCMC460_61410 [Mycobacterium sp. 20KCMC460]GLB86359.1 hypothetical protein SRL2020028_56150 [Mycobacterium kiyosense]GLB91757.1 hypothetical protein SRL2020130_45740 [Mycobacterium kiyosense]GLB98800.1 hypothetical protein SRL2020226_55760 [Mycobacterium kiyosense]GLC05136.1 hypothetical protein SRL2020400_57270 [Mycobacterium kiyosense]
MSTTVDRAPEARTAIGTDTLAGPVHLKRIVCGRLERAPGKTWHDGDDEDNTSDEAHAAST